MCFAIVVYEIITGTQRFLSEPIATKTYSTETELPTITLCPRLKDLRAANLYGLDYSNYMNDGKFVPDNFDKINKTLDEIFQESINEGYFLLDASSNAYNSAKLLNNSF